jgi:ribonuclease HI
MDFINVYVDGSCINNGSQNAIAGYGVYFGEDDEKNEYGRVEGKQTNNTGELTAIIRALEILKDIDIRINIYTDSEYVMKCAGYYTERLAKNEWKTQNDKIPPNLKLLKKLYELIKNNKENIKLHHIKAHTNLQDPNSIGNYHADRLANLAIGVDVSTKVENKKNYITVSYNYKDEIKKLGGKWDANEKKWYYEDDISDDNKRAINAIELSCAENKELPPIIEESEKIYVKIPFKNKDAAKKQGARWDPNLKSWYYYSNNKNKDKIISLANSI